MTASSRAMALIRVFIVIPLFMYIL
jgi:hypothetical protein